MDFIFPARLADSQHAHRDLTVPTKGVASAQPIGR